MSVKEWHSPCSRVTAGTAMLALPLLGDNQSSGSCTGLSISWCLFCCQLYRNPLPKPCNCRMFCYPIPAASYYLLRLSRVTSPGLIVITDKAWGQELCLSSAGGLGVCIFHVICWGVYVQSCQENCKTIWNVARDGCGVMGGSTFFSFCCIIPLKWIL